MVMPKPPSPISDITVRSRPATFAPRPAAYENPTMPQSSGVISDGTVRHGNWSVVWKPVVPASSVKSETVSEETPGTFVFSGKVGVDEVRDRLGIEIQREGFETVGGFLLSHLGRMPYVGETFDIEELACEVLEVERRRITKVRVRRS